MTESLHFKEILKPERIVVGLESQTFVGAVSQLIDRLEAEGVLKDRAGVEALVAAEAESGDLPTLGDRALLAHYRTDASEELAVALGTSKRPFSFAPELAPDARILLLVVGPRSAARYYLKVIGSLSRLLRDPAVTDAVADASHALDVLEAAGLSELSIRPELTVQDLMSRRVNAVPPETPLSEVLRVMVRHGRRAVPVVSDTGEVLGLVTEQELLQHFLPQITGGGALPRDGSGLDDADVRDVMQRSVMCLSEDQLISDVAGIMQNKQVARFPVVREGALVGFLSRTDIIRKLLDIAV